MKVAKYRGKRQSFFKHGINDRFMVGDGIYIDGIYMENRNTMVGGYALSEVYRITRDRINYTFLNSTTS